MVFLPVRGKSFRQSDAFILLYLIVESTAKRSVCKFPQAKVWAMLLKMTSNKHFWAMKTPEKAIRVGPNCRRFLKIEFLQWSHC